MTDNDDKTPPDNVVRVAFGAPPKQEAPPDPAAGEKLEIFTRLIDGGMVLVNLDARTPGAIVPPQFAGDAQLGLNFSHRFGLPDFAYDERGVRATLSFQGTGIFCDVPWSAVFMLRSYTTGEVVLFPESLPPEIAPLLEGLDSHLTAARPADEEAPDGARDEDRTERELPRAVPKGVADDEDTAASSGSDSSSEPVGTEGAGQDGEPPDDEPPGGGDGPRRPPGLRLVKG